MEIIPDASRRKADDATRATVKLLRDIWQAEIRPGSVLCHDVRHPQARDTVVLRKGAVLTNDDIALVRWLDVRDVHVLVPDEGDLLEDAASARLACTVIGEGVQVDAPHDGQVNLRSHGRGWLRINPQVLQRVNTEEGVLVFTAPGERAVDADETIGGVKCAPLVLGENTIRTVESVCAEEGRALDVLPFPPRHVAFVVVDRLNATVQARAQAALSTTFAWFGSDLTPVVAAEARVDAVANAFQRAADANPWAILVAGASATDPADVVFDGLRLAGGQVEQVGIPLEPGTACWTGYLGGRQVLALASCELFGRPGAVDLLFPRLLLGEPLDRALLARLAYAGLIEARAYQAPYHRKQPAPAN